MNEKRIQQVMEIERRAQDMLEAARKDAEHLPAQAEAEAQQIVAEARKAAEEEARRILGQAGAGEQVALIVSSTEERIARLESLAAKNLEQAVQYVLDRVIGKA
jgi:vacuolar-type H+-ATPase subunit H